ncbi:hypothetical protein [Anaplasma marginale]
MPLGGKEQLLRAFAAFENIAPDSPAQDFFGSEEGKAYRVPLVKFVASALQVQYGADAPSMAEELVDSIQAFRDIALLIRSPVKLAEQVRRTSGASGEFSGQEENEDGQLGEGALADMSGTIAEGFMDRWSQGKKAVSEFLNLKSDFERKQELACEVDTFMTGIKTLRTELARSGDVSERRVAYFEDVDTLLEILFSQYVPRTRVFFNRTTPHQDMQSYVDSRKDIIIPAVRELLFVHRLDRVYDQKMANLLEGASSKTYLRSYLRSTIVARGFQERHQPVEAHDPGTGQQPQQRSVTNPPAAEPAPVQSEVRHPSLKQSGVQTVCAAPQYAVTRSKAFNALCILLFVSLFALLLLVPLLHEHIPVGVARDVITILAETLIAISIMALGCWLIFSGRCHEVHVPALAENAPGWGVYESGNQCNEQHAAEGVGRAEPATSPQTFVELQDMVGAQSPISYAELSSRLPA